MSKKLYEKIKKMKTKYLTLSQSTSANYYLISHHGFVQVDLKNSFTLKKVPSNICLFFTAPLTCQLSNRINSNTKEFYEKHYREYVRNPQNFSGKHITNNFIIYPPDSNYIDMFIDITDSKNFYFKKLLKTKHQIVKIDKIKGEKISDIKRIKLSSLLDLLQNLQNPSFIFIDTCREIFTKNMSNSSVYSMRMSRQCTKQYKTCKHQRNNEGDILLCPNQSIWKNTNIQKKYKIYKLYEYFRSELLKHILKFNDYNSYKTKFNMLKQSLPQVTNNMFIIFNDMFLNHNFENKVITIQKAWKSKLQTRSTGT